MKSIRIGNDINVKWSISSNGQPYNLYGKKLLLVMSNDKGGDLRIHNYTIDQNSISFTFRGSEQRYSGIYSLTLIENNGEDNMHTVDISDAFCLVDKCKDLRIDRMCGSVVAESVVFSSEVVAPRDGLSAYELAQQRGFVGSLDDWLASLKGEQGLPGNIIYPTFEINESMELIMNTTSAADASRFTLENGYLILNI